MGAESCAGARVFHSPREDATEALGAQLGCTLGATAVVALRGDLGAGKTCMVRGIARGLGVLDRVHSPTFTLMHEYQGRLPLYHFDAWMEGRERAFLEGGGDEWFRGEGISVVEWADRIEDWLPPRHLSICIEHRGGGERRIAVELMGEAPRTPDGSHPPGGSPGDGGGLLAALEALEPREGLEELH